MSWYNEMAASRASSDVIELLYGTISERITQRLSPTLRPSKYHKKPPQKEAGQLN